MTKDHEAKSGRKVRKGKSSKWEDQEPKTNKARQTMRAKLEQQDFRAMLDPEDA